MRIGGRGNDAAGTAKAFLWRALPWVPVAWCVDDAVVSVRRIDRPGIKVVAALSQDFDDDRCREGAVYAMLDKASYRYFSNVERGDVVCMPRPGSFYSSETRSFSGTKRREGGQMEMQRVVALENDLVAWKAKNRASGKEESKDATVPKGHCFVASEREDVAHVGVVPIGLIEAKVRCAAFGDDFLKIQRMEKKTWEEMEGGSKLVVRRRSF
tara:strand:+ start:1887 stop:2522 length:636 start_codon:yes stop_codon:yes gene_type:complete